jgi:hypothetical protein
MTPATVKSLPAPALGEMLLRQSPGCAWSLRRDGTFHAVYGDASRVFGRGATELETLNFTDLFVPAARPAWIGRLERAFTGETVSAVVRFAEGLGAFYIGIFPVRSLEGEIAFAGGMAYEMPEAGLVLRTLDALETDRARLSKLLHDSVGQSLSAAGLQLDLLRMDLEQSAVPVPERIGEIQAMLETVMGLVRDFNRELYPALAGRIGLRAALDRLAGRLRAEFKGNVRVFADATAQPPPEAAAALYRIAEEAAGHATLRTGCSAIEILLKSLRGGPALEIRDNAPGFDGADSAFQGLQLLAMRHYADRAGIELQVDSTPHKGTVVRALCRFALEPGPTAAAPGPEGAP